MVPPSIVSLTLSAFLGLACASASPGTSNVNVIDLGYAEYQGVVNTTTKNTAFLGIRYAAPPTGKLRWREPQAPTQTNGIQLANVEPDQCFQGGPPVATFSQLSNSTLSLGSTPSSEDCLFLNVWVPGNLKPKQSLPVVFWIHGGGYFLGSASGYYGSGPFDGNDLIKEAGGNVVAVVIQYRLGVFGFLAGSEIKAAGALNAGLLDQQFALEWVQQHISKFGGDPTKVTIWGESAGAGSIIQHIVANDGKTSPPLFRAAMTSSTYLPSQYRYDDVMPQAIYNNVVAQTNCSSEKDTLTCLRNVDAGVLQTANINATSAVFGIATPQPVVDGKFITDRPTVLLRCGKINGEALLSVVNSNEGVIFVNQSAVAIIQIPNYIAQLFPNLKTQEVAAAAQLYKDLGSNINQADLIYGESILICPTYYLLRAFNDRAFKGEFAVPPALHGSDVFHYFPSMVPHPALLNADFENAFAGGFLNFAQNLDPNVKSSGPNVTPCWNTWSSQCPNEMRFNQTAAGLPDIRAIQTDPALLQRCAFWESVSASTAQ